MTLAEHQARCLALEKECKRLTAACERLETGTRDPNEYGRAVLAMARKALEWKLAADAYVRAASAAEVSRA